jgi:hypothetical protein
MADMTHQGPQSQTTGRTTQDERGHSPGTDLSTLSVAPHFMEAAPARLPSHTSDSVQEKWGERSFDTGVQISGRVIRRAA